MYKLTEEQKGLLIGAEFMPDNYFNPIQDINGDWFISKEEVDQCVNSEFLWVKDLQVVEFIPKQIDSPF